MTSHGFGDAITDLLSNPDRARALGDAGKEHVRDNFLHDRHLRQYLELLGPTAGERRSRDVGQLGSNLLSDRQSWLAHEVWCGQQLLTLRVSKVEGEPDVASPGLVTCARSSRWTVLSQVVTAVQDQSLCFPSGNRAA